MYIKARTDIEVYLEDYQIRGITIEAIEKHFDIPIGGFLDANHVFQWQILGGHKNESEKVLIRKASEEDKAVLEVLQKIRQW
jgi:hypothetical protein